MACSSLYAPVRWLLRDPLLGHRPMHPHRVGDGRLQLQCSECLRRWPVRPTFEASPVYLHRRFVAAVKGVANVVRFRKRAA